MTGIPFRFPISDRAIALVILALAAAGLTGCEPARVAVHGRITLDGQPLQEAAILFVPLEARRQKSGAAISEGNYVLAPEVGLLPGKYRVEIADNPPLGPGTPVPQDARQPKSPQNRRQLPVKYLHDSPLRCEIREADSSANSRELNFELNSAP